MVESEENKYFIDYKVSFNFLSKNNLLKVIDISNNININQI